MQDNEFEKTAQLASGRALKLETRPDGWFLIGELQEEVGPFTTLAAVQAFLEWLESLSRPS